jgi:hypothetical protein
MLCFKLIRQMMRTILFIVYDIVSHIERKINYFILFYFYCIPILYLAFKLLNQYFGKSQKYPVCLVFITLGNSGKIIN